MKLKFVIDTNIIISALMKDSITRMILIKSGYQFFYPEISFLEVCKYKDYIINRSKISESEYYKIIDLILESVSLIPEKKYSEQISYAWDLIGKVDKKDVDFIALALSIKELVVWSDDKHFEKQDRIKIFKTRDMMDLFL